MLDLEAIIEQLQDERSSLLIMLNNKNATIDHLQQQNDHFRQQVDRLQQEINHLKRELNFFKKAFGIRYVTLLNVNHRSISFCLGLMSTSLLVIGIYAIYHFKVIYSFILYITYSFNR